MRHRKLGGLPPAPEPNSFGLVWSGLGACVGERLLEGGWEGGWAGGSVRRSVQSANGSNRQSQME